MRSYTAELVYHYPAKLGEGALWDENRSVLWWVDITSGNVHCFNPIKKINETFGIGTPVGAVALDAEGTFILAVKEGFARYNTENGVFEMLAIVPHVNESIRFNDGKCDPEGRFWAGTLAEDGTHHAGTLYCLEKDFSVTEKLHGIGISNGIAWSPSGDTMYYIDSITQKVIAFQYTTESGDITTPRMVIEIPKDLGVPDGMCVDNLGMLWVALWDGGKVIQIHPTSGEILSEVVVPSVRKVTSCAFGGKDMNTLFITTARQGLTPEEERHEPYAGSLFAVSIPVSGLTTNVFHGMKKYP